MENEKIQKLINFYLLATSLKDKIRTGWETWNIDRQRVESVAEHIYGTCILAIAIDSEFDLNIDIYKVVMMLTLHEIEEVKIGDLTPFDKITAEEKRKIGKQAVEEVFSSLAKGINYIELIEEFEKLETKEAKIARMCDKLEADIQAKIYCEEKSIDMYSDKNEHLLQDNRIKGLLEKGAKSVADLFVEYDRPVFTEDVVEKIADYIKDNDLLNKKNNRHIGEKHEIISTKSE